MKFLLLAALVSFASAHHVREFCEKHGPGIYKNPHDESGRSFIRCEIESITMECQDGFFFDEKHLECRQIPVPPGPIDHSKLPWSKILTCPEGVEDQFFRNPYSCSRFYRCYRQGSFHRMDAMECLPTMYFDETVLTCLPIAQFRELNGECHEKELPKEIVDEWIKEREEEEKHHGHDDEHHGHDDEHHGHDDEHHHHEDDHEHHHHEDDHEHHHHEDDHEHHHKEWTLAELLQRLKDMLRGNHGHHDASEPAVL